MLWKQERDPSLLLDLPLKGYFVANWLRHLSLSNALCCVQSAGTGKESILDQCRPGSAHAAMPTVWTEEC